jgi:NADPH2 dehydrogenase
MFLRLWALGRASVYDTLEKDSSNYDYVSASDVPLSSYPDSPLPHPLAVTEIKQYVESYAVAAKNAMHAGFHGVEIHGGNEYLIDQFIQDVSNRRTDEYGGSIQNRARFALEVVEAVSKAIGVEKTALRVAPWNRFQGKISIWFTKSVSR